jgi:hypothetical protein
MNSRLAAAKPIVVSGICKHEAAKEHMGFLETIIEACQNQSHILKGHIYCISSDGEAK